MKTSIENFLNKCDEQFSIYTGLIGGGLGIAAGIAAGIYLGESANEYIEVLKHAPPAIQYTVNGISAVTCGGIGAATGNIIAQIPFIYKFFKNF